jgi:hypothetical protein
MSKKKLKLFLKIFFLLLIIQLIIVVADVLLTNADSSLSEVTATIISVFSFPLRLINRNLPFYTGEGFLLTLMFWVLNLVIQTMPIYAYFRVIKKIK